MYFYQSRVLESKFLYVHMKLRAITLFEMLVIFRNESYKIDYFQYIGEICILVFLFEVQLIFQMSGSFVYS